MYPEERNFDSKVYCIQSSFFVISACNFAKKKEHFQGKNDWVDLLVVLRSLLKCKNLLHNKESSVKMADFLNASHR